MYPLTLSALGPYLVQIHVGLVNAFSVYLSLYVHLSLWFRGPLDSYILSVSSSVELLELEGRNSAEISHLGLSIPRSFCVCINLGMSLYLFASTAEGSVSDDD